jgi:hypothetical protein
VESIFLSSLDMELDKTFESLTGIKWLNFSQCWWLK